MSEGRRSRSTEAFFGRRHGKTLSAVQSSALERLLPGLKIDLSEPPPPGLQGLFPAAVHRVRLEIGFGGGEHLHLESGHNSDTGFIGVEPFVNGMARLLSRLDDDPRQNLRLYDDDATRVLDWLLPSSLDGIDVFYPDPWPKKKHWKRRFISSANLDRFARVMRSGAIFRFASDIDTYVNWTLLACRQHPSFDWVAASPLDWRTPFEGWPGTRYEAKALQEGRTPSYLTFRRI